MSASSMSTRWTVGVVVTIISIAISSVAGAAVITVRQDGTGDFLTVTDAVAAASANDTIDVGPGTYLEGAEVAITLPLTIVSTNGADLTRLHGAGHRIVSISGVVARVTGLTFYNGNAGAGGAALVSGGAQVTFEDCVFEDNFATAGGAIYVSDSNLGLATSLTAIRCTFIDNSSAETGGAVSAVLGATADFIDSRFEGNSTGVKGGAVWVFVATGNSDGCLYVGNTSLDVGGAFYIDTANGTVVNNTFVDNTSPGLISGTITVVASATNEVSQNIIVGETAGFGLLYWNSTVGPHACNVYWDNADGPIDGAALGPDDVVGDPLFCNAAAGDYTIFDSSPASATLSACGALVGAFPVGCTSTVAVEHRPWSEIKQLYR